MNKRNLEILGLEEPVTREEIKNAYETLRAKYLEERFMDGEAGNNAARMLNKIEAAYTELMNEFAEASTSQENGSGEAFERVEELIRAGNLADAQHALDGFNERSARWHYLQSVVFYKKNWINESKKQLEIALQLDPNNAKYAESLRKLNDNLNSGAQNSNQSHNQGAYSWRDMDNEPVDQMGGDMCSACLEWCYCSMCLNCLCNGCIH